MRVRFTRALAYMSRKKHRKLILDMQVRAVHYPKELIVQAIDHHAHVIESLSEEDFLNHLADSLEQ